jgi:hypothetical protein
MRYPKRLAALATALALPLVTSGCIAAAMGGAAAGMASFAYTTGALETTVKEPLEEVWGAVIEANEELGFVIKARAKDKLGARVESTQAQGGDIRVVLEPVGPQATKISIRIGTFGDERKSRLILRHIQENL